MALISKRMTYSSLYVTTFLIEPQLRELSYFVRGDGVSSWVNSCLQYGESVGNRSGKKALELKKGVRDMRYPGARANNRPGVPGPTGL